MKKIISLILLLNIALFAEFKSINYEEVKELEKTQAAVIVDIRTPPEWKETGVIPNSKKIMFFDDKGNYDVVAWYKEFSKYVPNKEHPFVLVCRTASRTNMLGEFLDKEGYKHVYQLKGGITYGYKMMGFKTVK